MATLADLLNARTRRQWRDLLLGELRDAGFAVSLAASGDNRRNAVEMVAAGLEKVDQVIAALANGAFLGTAVGDWLKLRAKSGFDVDAKLATMARGTVRLTCASTAGPYAIVAGAVWVGRAAVGAIPARRFQNTSGGALVAGGYLDVAVSAEAPGTAYNLGAGQIATLFSGLPGVSVTNDSDWLTSPGTDDEATDPLRQRARDRWGTLGRGANDAAYRYIATTASAEVTRVRVYPGAGDGTLEVLLASDTGGVSSGAVSDVQADVERLAPRTDVPTVRSVVVSTITLLGDVRVRAAQLAAAQAAADVERLAFLKSLDIGDAIDLGAIYAILRRPGVIDVDITQPPGDTAIAYDAVAGLDFSALVWTGV